MTRSILLAALLALALGACSKEEAAPVPEVATPAAEATPTDAAPTDAAPTDAAPAEAAK